MAEIAAMKTHIINYAKIRDVYVAYRKASYSQKFKADHESDILLHQAAKKYFDESELKNSPQSRSYRLNMLCCWLRKKRRMQTTARRGTARKNANYQG